ncbi:MAG: hypothetical protein II800_03605 [Lachnospiraceae bacterium]|nr:hypothetical protein [Lachnospiraceae bacterium]
MRRLILKILYIAAVFLLSIVFFISRNKTEVPEGTTVMDSAHLPLIRLYLEDGQEVATLHGYLDEMDVRTMRGGILPLSDDRRVTLRLFSYNEAVDGMRYEVRDITGERLVEQTEITERSETENGDFEASFAVKDLIGTDEEYMLIIKADTGAGTASYYTRIMKRSQENADFASTALRFAKEFHENTFDSTRRDELTPYLESNRSGDNTSFAHVNIHSSLAQVTWGELPVIWHDTPSARINDLRGDSVTVTLTGSVTLQTESESRYLTYDVTEDFRIRQGKSRIHLLDYERTMQYRFSGDPEEFGADRIELGIGSEDFPFMENDDGSMIAFSAGRKLYSYRKSDHELSVLFAFADEENADDRCTYDAHDYQLLSVDEAGNVRFLVVGYMNRGRHEGRVGVAFYTYEAGIRQINEQVFMPVNAAPEVLCACVARMAHAGGKDELYLMPGDDVIAVDSAANIRTIIEGAAQSAWFRSDSGAVFALADRNEGGKRITIVQFRSGNVSEVTADPGTRLIPLGFMQEDLVYGVVRETDIRRDQAGNEVYAMSTVLIRDMAGDILENYRSPGYYVISAEVEGNQIRLQRVQFNEETGYYEEAPEDQIINTLEARQRINRVISVTEGIWERVVQIECGGKIADAPLKVVAPRFGENKEKDTPETSLFRKAGTNGYYVYGTGGRIVELCAKEADAVIAANEIGGAVLDPDDRLVWARGSLQTRNQIMAITHSAESTEPNEDTAAYCLQLMLEHRGIARNVEELLEKGESFTEILEEHLPGCRALNLTGCDMSSVLYYVNLDIPVLASMRDGGAMLLIGFNDTEVVVVDPDSRDRVYKLTRSAGTRLFDESGNRFTAYYFR